MTHKCSHLSGIEIHTGRERTDWKNSKLKVMHKGLVGVTVFYNVDY